MSSACAAALIEWMRTSTSRLFLYIRAKRPATRKDASNLAEMATAEMDIVVHELTADRPKKDCGQTSRPHQDFASQTSSRWQATHYY